MRKNFFLGSMIIAVLTGCSTGPSNPSFALKVTDAKTAIDEMQAAPQPLERPLVILGGWGDPGLATARLHRSMGKMAAPGQIITLSFAFAPSFDECRERVLHAVEETFPSDDPEWTTEVDVLGLSMGGLIARHAANGTPDGRRLKIARLYTISTPHRGASMAGVPTWDPLVVSMRPGSDFLQGLEQSWWSSDYKLYPYVRLGDMVVGCDNAAPPEQVAWWVPNRPLELAHASAPRDPRILADIMRRLRGETPYATEPRTPIPADDLPSSSVASTPADQTYAALGAVGAGAASD